MDGLIAAAFGPGRYAKTAERLREGSRPLLGLVAWNDETAIGAVRLWPVRIGAEPAAFLGPIAVQQAYRQHGVGGALVEGACGLMRDQGGRVVLLVGDPPFFGPLGFTLAPGVRLPGPVDPARVLWRALEPGALRGVGGSVTQRFPPAPVVSTSET